MTNKKYTNCKKIVRNIDMAGFAAISTVIYDIGEIASIMYDMKLQMCGMGIVIFH